LDFIIQPINNDYKQKAAAAAYSKKIGISSVNDNQNYYENQNSNG
jgi:hypothetical protein